MSWGLDVGCLPLTPEAPFPTGARSLPMRTRRSPNDDLRLAIDCLPTRTRVAMLEGIAGNAIIAGAYSDGDGGVCPMLAAHRCGGRTNFISFAKAWDAFTGVKRARRATEREIRILRTHIEASLFAEQQAPPTDLSSAIQAHESTRRSRRSQEALEVPALADAIQEHQAAAR
ncbi:MAG: hypothetical protein JWM31_2989, partial [Solirubrobacterales bacterium]|nr:hypothetical protein [Solirubrobacterales bacterium]